VNGEGERIGAALHEMAAKITPPRLDTDALWRAGRRRRRAALASAGSVVTAAALVPLVLLSVLTGAPSVKLKQPWPPAARPHPAIEFRQVARVVHKPCPHGSHGLPGTSRHVCYHLTSTGMTARIESARVVRVGSGRNAYEINVSLMPAYRHRFEALTAGLAYQQSPRCRLAIIVHGVVLLSPQIIGPLSGSFQIGSNPGTRAATTHLLHRLEGH
jgi:hypothetical protein